MGERPGPPDFQAANHRETSLQGAFLPFKERFSIPPQEPRLPSLGPHFLASSATMAKLTRFLFLFPPSAPPGSHLLHVPAHMAPFSAPQCLQVSEQPFLFHSPKSVPDSFQLPRCVPEHFPPLCQAVMGPSTGLTSAQARKKSYVRNMAGQQDRAAQKLSF